MAYDAFGNPTSIIRDCCGAGHLNQTISSTHDGIGNLLTATDPNGNVTTNTYDLDRRTVTTTLPSTAGAPSGLVSAYAYDPDSRLLQTQQSTNGALVRQTSTTYTLTGKTATTTDANGNGTLLSYDADDRLSSIADPLGRTTTYGYDALGRRISVSNPAILSGTPLLQRPHALRQARTKLCISHRNRCNPSRMVLIESGAQGALSADRRMPKYGIQYVMSLTYLV